MDFFFFLTFLFQGHFYIPLYDASPVTGFLLYAEWETVFFCQKWPSYEQKMNLLPTKSLPKSSWKWYTETRNFIFCLYWWYLNEWRNEESLRVSKALVGFGYLYQSMFIILFCVIKILFSTSFAPPSALTPAVLQLFSSIFNAFLTADVRNLICLTCPTNQAGNKLL